MVKDAELLRQTAEMVLGTNKGEWALNPDEGIDFRAVLGKKSVRKKGNSNIRQYESEIDYLKSRESGEAERLQRRLDGDI